MALLECPMCDFAVLPSDDYVLQLHFEQLHTTGSPFKIQDDSEAQPPNTSPEPSSKHDLGSPPASEEEEEESTVTCPEPDCGEVVLLLDFNEHLDYHNAETLSFDEATGTYHSQHSSANMHATSTALHAHAATSKDAFLQCRSDTDSTETSHRHRKRRHRSHKHGHRKRSGTDSSEKSTLSRSMSTFNPFTRLDKRVKPPSKSARLGKSELGPYAWEDRMPAWLHNQLAAGPKVTAINRIGRDGRLIKQEQTQNETAGLIPILAQLSALDPAVEKAYYCHPSTLHVGKTPREGGFCGYRNIQMLLSYLQGAKAQGHEEFPGRTPGILVLQDLIETAWDKGINSIGRIQTGGIRDTRKYIGTPEAQALFLSTEINCAVEMFSDNHERKVEAHESLLDAIERYFARAADTDGSNVYKTLVPPIYLQQPGHSITIVGFERRCDGVCNLIAFDPMYSTSPAMHKLLGRKNIRTARPEVLHAYRRGPRQLRKHAAFEILMLTATPPMFPAWDVLRQFPDCRFVYAFFRSRTLGYDVYPEDYFLQNFPWQQYGGLWVCDEARFARTDFIHPLQARALRYITAEGALSQDPCNRTASSPLKNSRSEHFPTVESQMHEVSRTQFPGVPRSKATHEDHYLPTLEANVGGSLEHPPFTRTVLDSPESTWPHLSCLTEVSRRYPGFPTCLSPTPSAKNLFPSPASEHGSRPATPRPGQHVSQSMSPLTSEDSRTYKLCYGFEHQLGHIDDILASSMMYSPADCTELYPSPDSPQINSLVRALSPRAAMLKWKQIPYGATGGVLTHQGATAGKYPGAIKSPETSPSSVFSSCFDESSPASSCIEIANGTEASTTSPISPTGVVLTYTSRRPIDSGLLGVRPLSEEQVAEYRFWRPCTRRVCPFGCGRAHEGEWAAAKRLFRQVEDVMVKEEDDVMQDFDEKYIKERNGDCQGKSGMQVASESYADKAVPYTASVWAGRRLVTNWNDFVGGCEREGVANF